MKEFTQLKTLAESSKSSSNVEINDFFEKAEDQLEIARAAFIKLNSLITSRTLKNLIMDCGLPKTESKDLLDISKSTFEIFSRLEDELLDLHKTISQESK